MATAGLLIAVMFAHIYRLFSGTVIMLGTHQVPMWASAMGVVTTAMLAAMICVEAKK